MQLQAALSGYTEGDPSHGPLDILYSFVTNDTYVPEHVMYGPASKMTQVVRNDQGVHQARVDYSRTGDTSTGYSFSFLQFARESVELSLTTHMLGGYWVRVAPTPEGKLFFLVYNKTGRESGTRNPVSGEGATTDVDRGNSEWFGTIHQMYYWTEDVYDPNFLQTARDNLFYKRSGGGFNARLNLRPPVRAGPWMSSRRHPKV